MMWAYIQGDFTADISHTFLVYFSVIWKIWFKYSFKDSLLSSNKTAWIIALLKLVTINWGVAFSLNIWNSNSRSFISDWQIKKILWLVVIYSITGIGGTFYEHNALPKHIREYVLDFHCHFEWKKFLKLTYMWHLNRSFLT